jgi:cysteine-rich repeat protein
MKKMYSLILFLFLVANLSAQNIFLESLQNENGNLKESIIIFYKSDCPYCLEMEKQISSNNSFQEQLKNKFNIILVDIEKPEGKEISKLYNITAVPAIIQNDSKSFLVQQSKGFGSLKKLALFLNIDYLDPSTIKKTTQVTAICGNGIVEIGEQCDDSNNTNGDGCSDSCKTETPAICGNGIVEIGEQCDDFNNANGDGCSNACKTETPAICGNGIVEIGEQCDDFNNANGDGCRSDCKLETLGVADYQSQFAVLGIYPNPFVNNIEVSFYLLHNSEVVFTIFDLTGKIMNTIKKDNLNFGKNEVQLQMDSFLPSGNYFLQIEINNSLGKYKQTKKIIKK